MNSKKYYEILEISPAASMDEVSQAYLNAKNAYSPENAALYSLMSPEESKEILDNIEEAYKVLSDPHKRKNYDEINDFNIGINNDAKYSTSAITGFSSSNMTHSSENTFPKTESREISNLNDSKSSESSSLASSKSLGKHLASNKYSLEFEIDEAFEKELAETQEFTGELLQKVREYKNVSIERLSEMTKVSKRHIKAIEEENADALPATVYARGYVYQYVKCLKLPADSTTNSYMKIIKSKRNEES